MNLYTLENEYMKVIVTDFAASVYQVFIKKNDTLHPVLSTPKSPDTFIDSTGSYGRTVGRTAGRLFKDQETVKYVDFKDENFLMHGGNYKFASKKFEVSNLSKESIELSLFVEDLEDQYTGRLNVKVTYELFEDTLIVKHFALCEQDSLLNMTFHPYFNLDQSNDLTTHQLKINSDYFLTQNEIGRFTNQEHVEGNHRDYRVAKPLIVTNDTKLDGIFLLKDDYACTLSTKDIQMHVYSNYDSLVVYTQNKPCSHDLSNAVAGTFHAGIAIECQRPQSIVPILRKNEKYDYYIKYQFKY